jgi:hypothetical protein
MSVILSGEQAHRAAGKYANEESVRTKGLAVNITDQKQ